MRKKGSIKTILMIISVILLIAIISYIFILTKTSTKPVYEGSALLEKALLNRIDLNTVSSENTSAVQPLINSDEAGKRITDKKQEVQQQVNTLLSKGIA